jgi:phosphoglycerol transferase MdoB-like AlkP superfamily enzyme
VRVCAAKAAGKNAKKASKMKQLGATIRFLLSVHVAGVAVFTLFRLVLYADNAAQAAGAEGKGYLLLQALQRGLMFDNVVACYIAAAPLALLGVCGLLGAAHRGAAAGCCVFFALAYGVSFAVAAADIPYFAYFNAHLDVASLRWLEFGNEARGMIFSIPQHYPYHALYLLSTVIFVFAVFAFGKKLVRSSAGSVPVRQYPGYILATLMLWGVCFCGARSSFGKRSVRVDDAYFCSVPLFNHVGINPVFYFARSYASPARRAAGAGSLMSDEEAVRRAQKALGCIAPTHEGSPLSRAVQPDKPASRANVVIVLLESMSTACLEYEHEGRSMTPYLHSLMEKSYYFENFYSAGIHTSNGIVSSLYGFPATVGKTVRMEELTAYYMGLPYHLREQGYRNLFFVGGSPTFAHMQSFLTNNGFDRIYSSLDLPHVKAANTWGVADEHLFEMGISKLREESASGRPFMATILTVSNHWPYVVPEPFKGVASDSKKSIVAYVDDCVKNFMDSAAREAWYHNTIFAFLGDHGKRIGTQKYDMSLTYNQIPCIIFSPLFSDAPKRFAQLGGQVDLFPTLLGLLNVPYVNCSLGVDLLKEAPRPCMYFVSDNQLGCLNSNYFYVRSFAGNTDFLYDLRRKQPDNLAEQYHDVAKALKNYALSMTITADYLVRRKKTRVKLAGGDGTLRGS